MKRKLYTYNQLLTDLEALNRQLREVNSKFLFTTGRAYDCTQLQLATQKQIDSHCCQEQIESGTPRECLHRARAYAMRVFYEASKKEDSEQ